MPLPPHTSDADLLAAYRAGNAAAFDTLYARHREWAFRLACRFARDEAEAADAVQEAFIYILRNAHRLQLQGRLTTLLYPAVRNAASTLRRASKRLRLEEVQDAPEANALPRADVDEGLARGLASLPEGQREVLLMRIVDEMSVEEVALALSVPTGTVKSRLHLALKALREQVLE